jgi:hypothetical protein
MTKTIPVVQDGILVDDQTPGPTICLDTGAWFAWLEAPATTRFSYALFNRARGYIDGFMTVRKEQRQRGTAYWSVYRRQGHRLRKLYLGPSAALTQTRLEQIAALLHSRDDPPLNPHFFVDRPSVWPHLRAGNATADLKTQIYVLRAGHGSLADAVGNGHPFIVDLEALIDLNP